MIQLSDILVFVCKVEALLFMVPLLSLKQFFIPVTTELNRHEPQCHVPDSSSDMFVEQDFVLIIIIRSVKCWHISVGPFLVKLLYMVSEVF